ncbi:MULTISPECIES: M3 family metallopeptidase [Pseudomonas fluorescens group]|uniref:M3 family metallopeptidase n=1 Tax=Pseudomonas fluorescens group TaxID=136843 RepID=UPI0008798BEB|nr:MULTISPECIES: M3 family metallopeptidase [Pseudomonas fluorescens group]SDU71537.1 oligopeptidase A [Pseudomonas moraviensis]
MPDTNPLLQQWQLPPWSEVRAEHLLPAVERIVADNLLIIENVIATQVDHPNWDDVVIAIDEADARLGETMAVIEFLTVIRSKDPDWVQQSALSSAVAEQFLGAKARNPALSQTFQRLAGSSIAASFSDSRKASLAKILRGFHMAGAGLANAQSEKLGQLNTEIALMQKLFMSNLKAASAAWSKHIADITLLAGLRPDVQEHLAANARQAGLTGWRLTLEQNTHQQIMTFAQNRALREECYNAYCTRASNHGPDAEHFDNEPVLMVLLFLRHEKARTLGFDNFAQLRLHDRMATDTSQVGAFLRRQIALNAASLAQETKELQTFAQKQGIEQVEPWDHDFLAEQLRRQRADGALDDLRQYFPLNTVLRSLCRFSEHLLGIRISEDTQRDRFDENVRLFEVSEHGQPIGYVYIDLFRREAGNDFAWSGVLRNRRVNAEGRPALPIASLHSNFTAAAAGHENLLSHQDLRVLLHEFGHCLHHVLTRSPHYNLSGISQLSRDAAEFIGQLFEHWAQSAEFLRWLGIHHKTAEGLSETRIKVALSALGAQRSRETAILLMGALFDLELHSGDGRSIQQVFDDVQREFAHLPIPADCRFANSFDFLATGYEASVYAYKWSGVLASEAFKRFEREGVFNPRTGRDLRETLLSGDMKSLPEALQAFLGQPINPELFAAMPG